MVRPKNEIVLHVLFRIYEKNGRRPISVSEIIKELTMRGYRISERWTREILERYVTEGLVEKIEGWPSKYKPRRNPPSTIVPLIEFLGPSVSGGEVSERVELRETDYTERVAKYLLDLMRKQPRILKLIEEFAPLLASMDPVEEAVELMKYLCESFYRNSDEVKRRRILFSVSRLIRQWYASVLGVPVVQLNPNVLKDHEISELCGNAGKILGKVAAIGISIGSAAGHRHPTSVIAYDEKRLRKYLQQRIIGRKMVEEVPVVNGEKLIYVSGHDTSYWPISIRTPTMPGYLSSARMYILSGISYSTWIETHSHSIRYVAEVQPSPARLAELRRDEAIRAGYLVTPEMIEESEQSEKRLVEAAMNTLEYTIMSNEITGTRTGTKIAESGYSWSPIEERPAAPPAPILHDGRLFPYEHKLGDYAGGYGDYHAFLVRLSIARFGDIVRYIMGDEDLTIIGVVKRPRSPTLHPLLIWGLRKAKEKTKMTDDEFWENVSRWLYERHEIVALFRGLYNKWQLRPNTTFRTAIILRRYWAADTTFMEAFTDPEYGADEIKDEYSKGFWLEKPVFSRRQLEVGGRGLRGYLRYRGVEARAEEVLAYVLANATVALYYILPPTLNILETGKNYVEVGLPRYELLVRPISLYGFDVKRYSDYIKRVINGTILSRTPTSPSAIKLFDYEPHEVPEDLSGGHWAVITIVPHHIKRADEYSKQYDNLLRSAYLNELKRAMDRIIALEEKRKAPTFMC